MFMDFAIDDPEVMVIYQDDNPTREKKTKHFKRIGTIRSHEKNPIVLARIYYPSTGKLEYIICEADADYGRYEKSPTVLRFGMNEEIVLSVDELAQLKSILNSIDIPAEPTKARETACAAFKAANTSSKAMEGRETEDHA